MNEQAIWKTWTCLRTKHRELLRTDVRTLVVFSGGVTVVHLGLGSFCYINWSRYSKTIDPTHKCFLIENSIITSNAKVKSEYTLQPNYGCIIFYKCVIRKHTAINIPLCHSDIIWRIRWIYPNLSAPIKYWE